MTRGAHGIELTAAGEVFLNHARLALAQAEAAAEGARRASQPIKPIFAIGFLTGQEVDWLSTATNLLMDEMLNIEVRVFSGFSTTLADDLQRGKLDIAFLRPEPKPDLEYKLVTKEPLVAIMPNDHSLAAREAVEPSDFVAEKFVGISNVAPILRSVVNDYLAKGIVPALEIDNYMMAISFVTSTRGVALLPVSVLGLLPSSVVSRPLMGEQPTVDLVLGYHKANGSQILRKFLSKIDDATVRVYGKQARRGAPGPNQV